MKSNKASPLSALQKEFGVTALGEGDPVVGFNVLATMACTLANLAPDNDTVLHPDGRPLRLGTSLLVSGSASASAVVDEVVTEVGRKQANLRAHLKAYFAERDQVDKQPYRDAPPMGESGASSYELVGETTEAAAGFMPGSRQRAWLRVLAYPPVEDLADLAERPKFLVGVGKAADLGGRLTGLRTGRPLVHFGPARPEDLAGFAETGAALLDGRHPGDGDGTVRGNLLITDPMGMIIGAAKDADAGTAWLGGLLWLTDGDAGPEAPGPEAPGDGPSAAPGGPEAPGDGPSAAPGGPPDPDPAIHARFQQALVTMMTRRLNLPLESRDTPGLFEAIPPQSAARWTAFLRKMEPRLPGISGACRNLLTSLALGLGEMAKLFDRPLKLTGAGVGALARFLVRRMANSRLSILRAGEIARREEQIRRIYHKLGKDAADGRTICRNLKIVAAERDECLRWLVGTGLVIEGDRGWERREGRTLDFSHATLPVLDV